MREVRSLNPKQTVSSPRLRWLASPWLASALLTLVGLSLGLVAVPLAAQVDIESLRLNGADTGVHGMADLAVTVREGNVDLQLVDIGGRSEWRTEGSVLMLIGRADIAWKDGSRFSNHGLVHLRQTLRIEAKVQPEWYGQIDYAKSRSLDLRRIAGFGPRFQLVTEDHKTFAVAASYMIERETLNLPTDAVHPDETTSHRLSTYITGAFQKEDRFTISGTAYFQPELDNWGDYRILGDGSLGVALGAGFGVRLSLSLRYDDDPPDTRDGLDLMYRTGFSFRF